MPSIESKSTTERFVRSSLMAFMICGFSLYSFYDGYIGYPKENVEKALEKLGYEKPYPEIEISQSLTKENVTAMEISVAMTLEELTNTVGVSPLRTEDSEAVYYFARGGVLEIKPSRTGRVRESRWIDAPHSETSLLFQKIMGFGLAPLGLWALIHLIRVVTFSANLNTDGLKVSGKPRIPFSAMKRFDGSSYKRKGWVDLVYETDGMEQKVRLDEYHIKHLKAMINAICAETGLATPLPNEDEDQNAMSAESEAVDDS